MEFHIDFNWQIQSNNENWPVDPLLLNLLSAIDKHGSLQSAARDNDVSYRHAWGLMEKWRERFQLPLIEKHRGRGTRLAPAGQHLLQAHQHLQARLLPQLSNQATQLRQQIQQLRTAQTPARLKVFASHGLAVSALRDELNQQQIAVDLHFHGSLESLLALQQQQCDIAGFHIPTGPLGKQLAPDYLSLIDPETTQLCYLVKRQQGIMIANGNPLYIQKMTDLTRPDVRFINRQRGSGTRLLLDQMLLSEQLNGSDIQGYNQEEFTHMAVAAMVASGVADCGFGIAAVAAKFNLDFLPLCEEHYCLAIPKSYLEDPRIQSILAFLKSDDWHTSQADVPGYDVSQSGQFVSFADIFEGR